jgi:hypothetical protein
MQRRPAVSAINIFRLAQQKYDLTKCDWKNCEENITAYPSASIICHKRDFLPSI